MPKNATPKPKPDDPEQSKRFAQTAEELGVDESETAFERTFGLIAQTQRAATPTIDPTEKEPRKR